MRKNIQWFWYEFGKLGHLDREMIADLVEWQGAGLFVGFAIATLLFIAPWILFAIVAISVVASLYHARRRARSAQEDDPRCD
jgi:hypothetical protein